VKNKIYLTTEELGNELSLSVGAVRNRLSRGDPMPPSIKIGRRRLFPVAEFHAWMNKHIRNNDEIFHPTNEDGFAKYR